jgi:allantoate deiminase
MPAGPIDIDPALVERYILELGAFGAYGETGVWRTVYSPEWVAATDKYALWCSEAGLVVHRDAVGNVWGKLAGSTPGQSIVSGSHIDSQRPGGRYDGALGALAGLIAIGALKQQLGQPKRTLEALSLCEEEGSRFPGTNFWGSRAITGRIRQGDAETMVGYDASETIADAMRSVGLDPARIPEAQRHDIDSFIELHIEQGPILEQAKLPVAIVNAITGIRHYHVTLSGVQNHAGGFPMDMRNDPMAGFAEIVSGVINTAHRFGRPAVTTVGRAVVWPNGPAVIPREIRFTVDARHPDPVERDKLYAAHEGLMLEVARRCGLEISWEYFVDHPPCPSDPGLVSILERVAGEQGVRTMTMAFVQSKDGRSHTPEEFSSIEHIVDGIRVLAAGLHALAY